MTNTVYHPSIAEAVKRHQEFFNGQRSYLIKVKIAGIDTYEATFPKTEDPSIQKLHEKMIPEIPYDGLDWDKDFQQYYKSRIHNARLCAEYRCNLHLGDDYIPCYYPYFGSAIHHAGFGGKIEFGGGTSYGHPVIEEAYQWENLHFSVQNVWIQRLGEAMAYCSENGGGVLISALRGVNGPMDMANAVLGNQFFIDVLLDDENTEALLQVCTDACDTMCQFQREHAAELCGGFVSPMGNMWMPVPMFGHISVDASLLTGPSVYNRYEKNRIEKLAEQYHGFLLHTHMMGFAMHKDYAATKGIQIIRPSDDPKQPTVKEKITDLLEQVDHIPLMLEIRKSDIPEIIPHFRNKRGIFELYADSHQDAIEQLEQIKNILQTE